MNRRLLLAAIVLLVAQPLWAQGTLKNVSFQFLPYMSQSPMVLGETTANNPTGAPYTIDRAQFYVSGITLIHDGGQLMPLSDTYLLVNAAQTDYPLGQYAIENLEGLRFDVGVDAAVNHNDPTLYPANHPLALQIPSMHWGWSSGYRFVALEGGTIDGTEHFEFHTVGDEFLTPVELSTSGISSGSDMVVPIYTNYAEWLLTLSSNIIAHGGGHNIEVLMSNINKYGVFSTDVPTAIAPAISAAPTVKIWAAPNPFDQQTVLHYDATTNGTQVSLWVYDMTGRVVWQQNQLPAQGQVQLSLPAAAAYQYVLRNSYQQSIGHGTLLPLAAGE